MKRKVKKFSEGNRVYDKEDEGILGAKIKYREDEEGRKYTAGRANPMDRNPQEQRYYSADDIKGKLSGLFGGSSEDSKSFSKFKDLESVGGSSRRPRTIEEQIGRKAEPKAEPKAETKTNSVDFSKYDTKSYTSEREGGGSTSTTGGGSRNNAPKADKPKKEAAPKKSFAEDAKPLPGVSKDKAKPQNLPAKPERKKEPTPYKDVVKSEDAGSQSFASKDEKKESGAKTRAGTTAKTPEIKTGTARTRAGTVVKSSDEPSAEAKTKAMSSLAAKIKKQDEENRFNFSPSKSPNRSYKSGGSVKSASARADGCAIRGKTRA